MAKSYFLNKFVGRDSIKRCDETINKMLCGQALGLTG
jgi:hypothetical protein